MNLKLAAAVAVLLVLVGGGAAAWIVLHRARPAAPPRTQQESAHSKGIDRSMAAVRALHEAPEGKTPCESAYNAFKASYDLSKGDGVKAVVFKLAPRDEFLRRCEAFPKELQSCLVPSYLAKHRDECEHVRPSPELLKPLVELRRATEPQRDEPSP